MTRIGFLVGTVALGLLPFAAIAADEHVSATPDTLKWGPAPPAYPKGAEFAIISGNPGQEGPFVLRIKAPAGYKVPPHVHPADENVTVLSGTFNFGMGEKFDEAKGTARPRPMRSVRKWQCALKARITCGGFHPESCRLIR